MPIQFFYRKPHPVAIARLSRCMEALLRYSKKSSALVELSLVGEKRIQELNQTFLKKNKVTDVLSFPQDLRPLAPGAPWHLGEIFIATAVARRQASRAQRTLTSQVIRLAVHGLIHLEGWDHEKSKRGKIEFEAMEKKYLSYLKRKGLLAWDGSLQF